MDLREAILAEHSKRQALLIRDYIGTSQSLFDELMYYFFCDEYRLAQRAAWAVSHCIDQYPWLINSHLEKLVNYLSKENIHVAVKRNAVRILQNLDLPEELLGTLADVCFNFLANPKEAAAVRIFSMQILFNICKKEPDLASELKLIIEEFLPYATAGFKSRGKKILKGIAKL